MIHNRAFPFGIFFGVIDKKHANEKFGFKNNCTIVVALRQAAIPLKR
ncbi:hypothetical protein BH11BAC7_BH11BAC7_10240 [soil metagenome]